MMMSLCSRTSAVIARSAVIPSRIVPPPCSGCGRRTASNRRTSAASFASRNSSRSCGPSPSPDASAASFSSESSWPPRTSTTTAMRDSRSSEWPARSSSGRSICGGRLSTTYQPRSSRALLTVERPAPAMPVTTSTERADGAAAGTVASDVASVMTGGPSERSGCVRATAYPAAVEPGRTAPSSSGTASSALSGTASSAIGVAVVQPVDDGRREHRTEPGHVRDVLRRRLAEPGDGAEVLQQLLHPRLPQPRHRGELRADVPLAPRALVGDREPVRLVAQPLHQEERVAVPRQDHREVAVRLPELLEPLRDAGERDAGHARVLERALRGRDLRLAAVDEQQVRPVREPGAALLRRCRLLVVEVRDPAAQHLVDRVGVVGGRRDVEAPVLVLARQPVLEDDHRRDDVRAGQVRDVEALDAQRRLVEAERLLQVGDGLRARGEVGAAPRLVEHQRLRRVARGRLGELRLLAALRDVEVRPAAPPQPLRLTALRAPLGQPRRELVGVVGQLGHEHLARREARPRRRRCGAPSRRARRAARRAPCRRPSCACRGCGRRAR